MTEQMHDQGDNPGNGYPSGHDRDGEPGLTADPDLTQYFEDLEDALHGAMHSRASQPLTWNGKEEISATFDSIKSALVKSIPPARPTPHQQAQAGKSHRSDSTQAQSEATQAQSDTTQAGG